MEKDDHIKDMKNEATLQNLADFDNKSLLIVDDDNPFRDRLSRAMEKKGFQVIQAEGVKKGIETVKINEAPKVEPSIFKFCSARNPIKLELRF